MTTEVEATGQALLDELRAEEAHVERSYIEECRGLMRIRDRKLYKATHPTWDAYCSERWALTRQAATRRIAQARAADELPPGAAVPPQRTLSDPQKGTQRSLSATKRGASDDAKPVQPPLKPAPIDTTAREGPIRLCQSPAQSEHCHDPACEVRCKLLSPADPPQAHQPPPALASRPQPGEMDDQRPEPETVGSERLIVGYQGDDESDEAYLARLNEDMARPMPGVPVACPTECDPDCPALCHEAHKTVESRDHDPLDCPSRAIPMIVRGSEDAADAIVQLDIAAGRDFDPEHRLWNDLDDLLDIGEWDSLTTKDHDRVRLAIGRMMKRANQERVDLLAVHAERDLRAKAEHDLAVAEDRIEALSAQLVKEDPPKGAEPCWRCKGSGFVATRGSRAHSGPRSSRPMAQGAPQMNGVKPSECKHPIGNRIGAGCAVCGATV